MYLIVIGLSAKQNMLLFNYVVKHEERLRNTLLMVCDYQGHTIETLPSIVVNMLYDYFGNARDICCKIYSNMEIHEGKFKIELNFQMTKVFQKIP